MGEVKNVSCANGATSYELVGVDAKAKRVLIIGDGFAPLEKRLSELGYSIEYADALIPEKIKGIEFTHVCIDEIATFTDVADLLTPNYSPTA